MTNYILNAESGSYQISGNDAVLTSTQIEQAVKAESRIPSDTKKAVIDYLKDAIQNTAENVTDIVLNLPNELSKYAEVIVDILRVLLGG